MTTASGSFERHGETLVPNPVTEGGWNPGTLLGRHVAGLVAWGAERLSEPDLHPSRLTVDMFRPPTMGATEARARIVRDGRRIRVVDVDIVVDEVIVCRGTVVFLRRSKEPRGGAWRPRELELPEPGSVPPLENEHWTPTWDQRPHGAWGAFDDSRGVWIREVYPFVAGEVTSPFVRAALAADNANGAINATPIGLPYINADLTLTLGRLPADEWIGLIPVSRAFADGVSAGSVDVYDVKGRIGQVAMIALADERIMHDR
jgi:hypothetical protein